MRGPDPRDEPEDAHDDWRGTDIWLDTLALSLRVMTGLVPVNHVFLSLNASSEARVRGPSPP
jgi:hypothetical protein